MMYIHESRMEELIHLCLVKSGRENGKIRHVELLRGSEVVCHCPALCNSS